MQESDPKSRSVNISLQHADNGASPSAGNYNYSGLAPPTAGDRSQETNGFVNSDPVRVKSRLAKPETEDDLFALFVNKDANEL